MDYTKTFNEILDAILQDYRNLSPAPDTTQGTLIFIKSACLASALWGVYQRTNYVGRQMFPDSCDTVHLDRWASIYGLTRQSGESDAQLLDRILSRLRRPPAGGNPNDFINWCKETTVNYAAASCAWQPSYSYSLRQVVKPTVPNGHLYIATNAGESGATEPSPWPTGSGATILSGAVLFKEWCADALVERVKASAVYENPRGLGSYDIATVSDTNNTDFIEEPSANLIGAIGAYIEPKRPICGYDYRVLSAEKISTPVRFNVPAGTSSIVKNAISAQTQALIRGLGIGKTLYVSQLVAIGINNGIEDCTLDWPAANVTAVPTGSPPVYRRVWDGTIDFHDGGI